MGIRRGNEERKGKAGKARRDADYHARNQAPVSQAGQKEQRTLGSGTECCVCGNIVFRATYHDGKWYGPCCLHLKVYGASTFPFSTRMVDGTRMTINSLRHLRQVERQHGVHFHAYNTEEKNFSDPPQQDPRVQDPRTYWKPIFGERLENVR